MLSWYLVVVALYYHCVCIVHCILCSFLIGVHRTCERLHLEQPGNSRELHLDVDPIVEGVTGKQMLDPHEGRAG